MNKKIISLVLALVMVLGTFTSVFAEAAKADAKKEEVKKTETKKAKAGEKVEKVVGKDNKIQYVIDKKLVEGYEDGTYGLDKNIKRSEITRLLVLANGNEELAKQLQGSMKIYSDVDAKHWANGVISVGTTVPSDANGIAMLAGYPDGSFKPENDVTYAELAKMLVVLAKEDLTADMVKNAKWATSWMTWAAQLGILDDVNVVDSNKAANRADAFTMVYNALYTMKEFKRVPANETRGIVSNLTSGKLTLNQDNEKVYDVTNATVIVDGINARRQIVHVNSLNDLDIYKGSLVRILTNDKNEVTHIIELGNPEKLALSQYKEANEYTVRDNNNVWEGVADATVKTFYYENIRTMKETEQKDINKSFAKIELKSDRTKADKITFYNDAQKAKVTLKINDKTEVYVANPYNNIMREVKDVNEALSLIGFHNYDGYKIPNVYAGFDTDDHTSAVKSFDSEKSTAKVIVFNVVSKDNDGDRYRVLNSSGSNFSTTLEDTDGKLYDRDNVLNKANFPLNYGDLLDVIEIRGDVIDKLLDHSKTKDFPVVRVVRTFDNDEIQVEDRFGNETLLYVGDADIFNAKQYKDLAKGDYLQFRANPFEEGKELYNDGKLLLNARDIEIVSILDDTKDTRDLFDESGSVLNVVQGIEDHTVVGIIKWVGEDQVEIKIESDNWDKGLNNTTQTYKVDRELADALKAYVGENVKFKAENKKFENDVRAYDFVLNDGKNTQIDKTVNALTKYKELVKALPEKEKVTPANYEAVKKDAEKAKDLYDNDLTKAQKEEVTPREEAKVTDALAKVKAYETNKANFAKDLAAVKTVNEIEVAQGKNNDKATVEAALVAAINGKRAADNANSREVKAENIISILPEDLNQPLKVKVKLESKNGYFEETVELTVKVTEAEA